MKIHAIGWASSSLLIATAFLFSVGLVMIFNTSSAELLDQGVSDGTHLALTRQIVYGIVGLCFAAIIWFVGYKTLCRLSFPLLVLISLLLLLNFVPGIGKQVNGAYRWIAVGGMTFQASEFAKLIIPLYFIHAIRDFKEIDLKQFLCVLAKIGVPLFLIFIEPDNSTTGVILLTLIALFVLARIRFKFWGWPLIIVLILGGVAASQMPHVSGRLKVYLDPTYDIRGKGHQPHQAKIAAGSGQVFGRGPGHSLQKLSYLPEAQNDYIAAIYAEEFGFIGVMGLITLYSVCAYCGFHIAFYAKDQEGYLLAATLTFLLSVQAFLNLGVVSGLLPSTGLNLPLFSQGGSSLMANIALIGGLLSVRTERSNATSYLSQSS